MVRPKLTRPHPAHLGEVSWGSPRFSQPSAQICSEKAASLAGKGLCLVLEPPPPPRCSPPHAAAHSSHRVGSGSSKTGFYDAKTSSSCSHPEPTSPHPPRFQAFPWGRLAGARPASGHRFFLATGQRQGGPRLGTATRGVLAGPGWMLSEVFTDRCPQHDPARAQIPRCRCGFALDNPNARARVFSPSLPAGIRSRAGAGCPFSPLPSKPVAWEHGLSAKPRFSALLQIAVSRKTCCRASASCQRRERPSAMGLAMPRACSLPHAAERCPSAFAFIQNRGPKYFGNALAAACSRSLSFLLAEGSDPAAS